MFVLGTVKRRSFMMFLQSREMQVVKSMESSANGLKPECDVDILLVEYMEGFVPVLNV